METLFLPSPRPSFSSLPPSTLSSFLPFFSVLDRVFYIPNWLHSLCIVRKDPERLTPLPPPPKTWISDTHCHTRLMLTKLSQMNRRCHLSVEFLQRYVYNLSLPRLPSETLAIYGYGWIYVVRGHLAEVIVSYTSGFQRSNSDHQAW